MSFSAACLPALAPRAASPHWTQISQGCRASLCLLPQGCMHWHWHSLRRKDVWGQMLSQQNRFAWCCLGVKCSSQAQQSNTVPSAIHHPSTSLTESQEWLLACCHMHSDAWAHSAGRKEVRWMATCSFQSDRLPSAGLEQDTQGPCPSCSLESHSSTDEGWHSAWRVRGFQEYLGME